MLERDLIPSHTYTFTHIIFSRSRKMSRMLRKGIFGGGKEKRKKKQNDKIFDVDSTHITPDQLLSKAVFYKIHTFHHQKFHLFLFKRGICYFAIDETKNRNQKKKQNRKKRYNAAVAAAMTFVGSMKNFFSRHFLTPHKYCIF